MNEETPLRIGTVPEAFAGLLNAFARLVLKLGSGKFLLVLSAAYCLVHGTVTKLIPVAAVVGIISSVFTHYFTKQAMGKANGTPPNITQNIAEDQK